MNQTFRLIHGDGLEFLKRQEKHSLFIVTDTPLNIAQRDIYNAAKVYMIVGGVEYLVFTHRPGQQRIGGEKVLRPYNNLLRGIPSTTIVDPFMGTGTIGEAALRMGHSFIGVEIIHDRYLLCAERLDAVYAEVTGE